MVFIESEKKPKHRIRSKRKTLRMLSRAFKIAGADKIILGYVVWFFLAAIPIWIWEPNINNYGDSLWFCFASATTIGFGDVTAVTHIGRIITVAHSIYSMGVIAIFTAVITSFFIDLSGFHASESIQEFMDDLEHLPDMSKEELNELSEKVKEFRKKI